MRQQVYFYPQHVNNAAVFKILPFAYQGERAKRVLVLLYYTLRPFLLSSLGIVLTKLQQVYNCPLHSNKAASLNLSIADRFTFAKCTQNDAGKFDFC